jgi:hypothetical protein
VKPLGGIDISWVVGGIAGIAFYLLAMRLPPRGISAPHERERSPQALNVTG